MGLQALIAGLAGDTWRSWRMVSLWPWPAVVIGNPEGRFTWDDYRCFTRELRPGDFIVTTSEPYFLSNRGIKGSFKHLAVYTGAVHGAYRDQKTEYIMHPKPMSLKRGHTGMVGKGTFERTVTHAISEGVVCQDLGELLFHADWAMAVRAWKNEDEQGVIVQTALDQIGLEYNFEFKPKGHPKWYCTQLGYYCCQKAGLLLPERVKLTTSLAGFFLPLDRFRSEVPIADAFAVAFKPVCKSVSCNDIAFARKSRYNELRQRLAVAPDAHS